LGSLCIFLLYLHYIKNAKIRGKLGYPRKSQKLNKIKIMDAKLFKSLLEGEIKEPEATKRTRGRKPGSTKKKKLNKEDAFMEAKAAFQEMIQNPEEIKGLAKRSQIQKEIRRQAKFSEEVVNKAIRRSRILQGLINQNRIAPKYLFNAIVWEEPSLHMRQIEIK